jgi:hypothetical protein
LSHWFEQFPQHWNRSQGGDTDYATMGLCSATLCEVLDVVVCELDAGELLTAERRETLPNRLEKFLDGKAYRIVHCAHIADADLPPIGTPFSQFRRRYVSPQVVYTCPSCDGATASVEKQVSIREYEQMGGVIREIDGLQVRE